MTNWVGLLYEFSSLTYQRRLWLEGIPGCIGCPVELMCGYFDDLTFSDREPGYAWAVRDGFVTQVEADAVEPFHLIADGYKNADMHAASVLDDSAWHTVVTHAADAWRKLRLVARPHVLALMQDRETRFGQI